MAASVILNDETHSLSQSDRLYINRDRAEGHTKLMRDYFNPVQPIQTSIFNGHFGCMILSSSRLQKPRRNVMIG
jgi:hypothetical protein